MTVHDVTQADIGTANKPKRVRVLILTVKNIDGEYGGFHSYGLMKWEDAKTAEQDASTLKTTVAGQVVDATYRLGQSGTGDVALDLPRMGGRVNLYDVGAASISFELPAH
ncbi:hypothetical protein [Streptomyces sp. Je 1-4 4N24_ara]|uniref:hypothetical protein n=1 Tax=Streptomyces sp. Je 1-4 4N24_ara TaxID=2993654 RepID=UPI002247EAA5|nr:hypothetical protein [Streptomyces sp. Je 1-4 4N24_ara]